MKRQLEPAGTLRALAAILFTQERGHLKTVPEKPEHLYFTKDDPWNIYLTVLCLIY